VDDHVPRAAFVQSVHCAAAVAVESAERRGGREEVVDGGAGGAGGGVGVGGRGGGVGCCWGERKVLVETGGLGVGMDE
jgi:hypothetical protein